MLLDAEQKAIFCRWLELQISTSKGIVEQMQKIGAAEVIMKRERTEQAACAIVLAMIRSGEEMTVGR